MNLTIEIPKVNPDGGYLGTITMKTFLEEQVQTYKFGVAPTEDGEWEIVIWGETEIIHHVWVSEPSDPEDNNFGKQFVLGLVMALVGPTSLYALGGVSWKSARSVLLASSDA